MTDRPEAAGSTPVGGGPGSPAAPTGGETGGGSSGDSSGDSRASRWVVPALMFVAGLLLGGVAVAAVQMGDDIDDPLAVPSISPSPSPSPSPSSPTGPQDVMVRIPASCVQVAEEADAAFAELDAFAEAVRDFDARRLQEFLDEFQEVRPRVEELSQDCQEAASEGLVDGELITPTPAQSS